MGNIFRVYANLPEDTLDFNIQKDAENTVETWKTPRKTSADCPPGSTCSSYVGSILIWTMCIPIISFLINDDQLSIWTMCIPHCDLTGIMVNKANHPQMALI